MGALQRACEFLLILPFGDILLGDSQKFSTSAAILFLEVVKLQIVFVGAKAFMNLVDNDSFPFKVF